MFRLSLLVSSLLLQFHLQAQVNYPYPVHQFSLQIEGKTVSMSYMDVPPFPSANGKIVVLLHGKNFNGYYWKNVIPRLTEVGYRVIVPDQLGWGRSDKPDIHYSFHLLAYNTRKLLDSLRIAKAYIVGHSMGGMLATRFTLMFPDKVDKLILENPIGLEDYKTFVPYQNFDSLYNKEKRATYDSYKKYQQTYYPQWKPEYEQYVEAQAEALKSPDFEAIARANAFTYLMIYEQPVCYEFGNIAVPTLLIIGQSDRTVVGKDQLSENLKDLFGQYPILGKQAAKQIKNSRLIELPNVGHIPHIQETERFCKELINFLN